jgi:hypothetical protein
VLRDNAVERTYVLQGTPHQSGVRHTAAVVGEDPDTGRGTGHQPELRQLRTLQALAHRTDRHNLNKTIPSAKFGYVFGGLRRIRDRCGVRHGQDRRVATPGGGGRAARHRFGVLAARLAEMGVQVDQAWQGDQTVGIESLGVRSGCRRVGQDTIPHQQVASAAAELVGARDQDVGHPGVSRAVGGGVSSAPPSKE